MLVPYLLFYTVEVAEKLLNEIAELDLLSKDRKSRARTIKFILWATKRMEWRGKEDKEPVENLLSEFLGDLKIKCPECGSEFVLKDSDLEISWENPLVKCPSCDSEITLEF